MNQNKPVRLGKRIRRVLRRAGFIPSKPTMHRGGKLVFFFNGAEHDVRGELGSLWQNDVFVRTLETASDLLVVKRNWSPLHYLRDDADYPEVAALEKKVVSVVLTQIAVYEMYRAWGVTPSAVAGISAGEFSAAYAAGVGDLQDAVQRTILTTTLIVAAGKGICFYTERLIPGRQRELESLGGLVIVDAPTRQFWTVPPEQENPLRAWLQKHHIQTRTTSWFMPHTPRLSHESFEAGLANLQTCTPRLPVYSGERGGRIPGSLDMTHWWRVIAQPVRAAALFPALIHDGYTLLVSMGAESETIGELRASLVGAPHVHVLDGVARDPATIMPPETRTVLQTLGFDLSERVLRQHRHPTAPIPPDGRAGSSPPPPDLDDPHFLQDPFACYRVWREVAALHYLPRQNAWLVLNYEDIAGILRDPLRYSSSPYQQFSALLSGNDPPDHQRMRQLLTPYFTRQEMLTRAAQIEQTSRRYVDALRSHSTIEFMSMFAEPVSKALACDLLGIGIKDLDPLRGELARKCSPEVLEAKLTGDGLAAKWFSDPAIPRRELVPLTEFMIGAGVITVKDFIANALYALLQHPQWMTRVRAHPAYIPALVEELIRFEPPVLTLLRRTRTEVRIAGVAIPQDALIYLAIGAANRDPQRFPQPDELVLERPAPRSLSFSIGPHHCLGVHLGRLECEILLRLLLTELPPLRAAQPLNEVCFVGAPHTREPAALYVGFG